MPRKQRNGYFKKAPERWRLYRPELHGGKIVLLHGELEESTRKLLAFLYSDSARVADELAVRIGEVAAGSFSSAAEALLDEVDLVFRWFPEGAKNVLEEYERLIALLNSLAVKLRSIPGHSCGVTYFKEELEDLFADWIRLQPKTTFELRVFSHVKLLLDELYGEDDLSLYEATRIGKVIKEKLNSYPQQNSFMRLLNSRDALLEHPREDTLAAYGAAAEEFQKLTTIAAPKPELLEELWVTVVWERETAS